MGKKLRKVLNVLNGVDSDHICPECGRRMIYETEDSLLCESCGYGVDVDRIGLSDEEYENLYPTEEEYLMSIGEYEEDVVYDDEEEYYDPEHDGMLDFDTMDSF